MALDTKDKNCEYCGDWFECRDHVIPASWTHFARRVFKGQQIVCSCNLCNSLTGDYVPENFGDKARFLITRYNKKFKRVLNLPHWTDAEIAELDYGLQSKVLSEQRLKKEIKIKLLNLSLVMDGGKPIPFFKV